MCKVIEERFNSQLGVIGTNRTFIDLQFGKGFSNSISMGRVISTDTLRRLSSTLDCSPEWLSGEDIKQGYSANLAGNVSISGRRLKSRREEIGYSQPVLANLVGKKYASDVSTYERKGTGVRRDTVIALCHYLKCSLEYLQGKSASVGEYPAEIPDSIREKQEETMVSIQNAVIARHISEANISPTALSKQIGVPRSMLSKIRSGCAKKVPIHTVKNLCGIFHLDIKDLILPIGVGAELINPAEVAKQIEEQEEIKRQVFEEASNMIEEKESKPISAEPVDTKVSLQSLAKITAFADQHPDLIGLLDQLTDLPSEQVDHIKHTLDLLIKGCIVS